MIEFKKQVCIQPQDSQTITSKIKLKELDNVNITVEASIEAMNDCEIVEKGEEGISDAVRKPIYVKPEPIYVKPAPTPGPIYIKPFETEPEDIYGKPIGKGKFISKTAILKE